MEQLVQSIRVGAHAPTPLERLERSIRATTAADFAGPAADTWCDLADLAKEALGQHPEKWRIVTLGEFLALPSRASGSNAEVRAGFVDADPIGSRYIYDYNDITNLHAMQTDHDVHGWGGTYERPSTLWISDLCHEFQDPHIRGPYMNPHGCMQSIAHLKWPCDVLRHAPSLHETAAASRLLSVDLFVVDYADRGRYEEDGAAGELLREQHRPFKVLLKVRLFDVWRTQPTSRLQLKSDLRFVMHEMACTPIDVLASVFVDVIAPKSSHRIRALERLFRSRPALIERSWVLPGSFVKGGYAVPLVLPYLFRSEGRIFAKPSTPLMQGTTPWCLRTLLGPEILKLVVPFVMPWLRNKSALCGSCRRESLTPGEDMKSGMWLSEVRDGSLGFDISRTGYMARRGVRAGRAPARCRQVSWGELTAGTRMMDATWWDNDVDEAWPEADSDDSEGDGFSEVREGICAAWCHPSLGAALLAMLREVRGARRHPALVAARALSARRWTSSPGPNDGSGGLGQALLHLSALQGLASAGHVVRRIVAHL